MATEARRQKTRKLGTESSISLTRELRGLLRWQEGRGKLVGRPAPEIGSLVVQVNQVESEESSSILFSIFDPWIGQVQTPGVG